MSTTVFAITNSAFVLTGIWNTGSATGRPDLSAGAWGCSFDVLITGTDATVRAYIIAGNAVTVTVDGGAPTTLTSDTTGYVDYELLSGVSDGVARHVRFATENYAGLAWLDRINSVSITGSSPSVSDPPNFSTQLFFTSGALQSNSRQEGGWSQGDANTGYNSPNLLLCEFPCPAVMFRAKCERIRAWTFCIGQYIKIYSDGGSIGIVQLPNTSRFAWADIATGLDTAEHEYELVGSRKQSMFLWAMMTPGGDGFVANSYTVRDAVAFGGDSITQGEAGTGNDATLGYAFRAARLANLDCVNLGINAQTCKVYGQTMGTVIGGLAKAPSQFVDAFGTNDLAQVDGPETTLEYTGYETSMLNSVRAAAPDILTKSLGIFPRSDSLSADVSTWNIAKMSGVDAVGSEGSVFIDTSDWIDAPIGVDGVHPDNAQLLQIAVQLAPYLYPSSSSTQRNRYSTRARPTQALCS